MGVVNVGRGDDFVTSSGVSVVVTMSASEGPFLVYAPQSMSTSG